MNEIQFPFSDTVAGYVEAFDAAADSFVLKTPGRPGRPACASPRARTPGSRTTSKSRASGAPSRCGRCSSPGGSSSPTASTTPREAPTRTRPSTWCSSAQGRGIPLREAGLVGQADPLVGEFYLKGPVPVRHRRLRRLPDDDHAQRREGEGQLPQETDTISRLVYGFATAYMMTGDERFLEGAERGTEYLREHMRFLDVDENIVYWYHGIDVHGRQETKIFASEFGDDFDGIPAYEQIYALRGRSRPTA